MFDYLISIPILIFIYGIFLIFRYQGTAKENLEKDRTDRLETVIKQALTHDEV